MDEETIETLRESSRNILVLNRRKHRDEGADVRRSMNYTRIHSDTVAIISRKLKTRFPITALELLMLKNALIDDVANIEMVLHTHGALRGLVREMTGCEADKQCAAAGCCCNLALGDSRAGFAVAKAAGPYLIAGLHNFVTEYAVTCAWTLGNLAGSGMKACELLIAQGSITKLVDQLANSTGEMKDASMYALVHFAYQIKDNLSMEHLCALINVTRHIKVSASAQLLFIASCHASFSHKIITPDYIQKLLRFISASIEKSLQYENVVYVFRSFANLNSKDVCNVVLNNFVTNNMVEKIKKASENEKLKDSVLWFLGNAYVHCSDHDFFVRLLK